MIGKPWPIRKFTRESREEERKKWFPQHNLKQNSGRYSIERFLICNYNHVFTLQHCASTICLFVIFHVGRSLFFSTTIRSLHYKTAYRQYASLLYFRSRDLPGISVVSTYQSCLPPPPLERCCRTWGRTAQFPAAGNPGSWCIWSCTHRVKVTYVRLSKLIHNVLYAVMLQRFKSVISQRFQYWFDNWKAKW